MNLQPDEFEQIRRFLHGTSGLALTAGKEYLVRTRLEPLLHKYQLPSFAALIARLGAPHSHAFRDEVIDAMATRETSFNRDGHPFEELRRVILPLLIQVFNDRRQQSGIPHPRIRIWSVAASTGQEPYSVAMAILDFLSAPSHASWTPDHFRILATDLSETSLQFARAGCYSTAEVDRGVTPGQKLRYFVQRSHELVISPELRRLVEFRRLNVLHNAGDLAGFDLVLCRNLLIYLDEAARSAVCRRLAASLNPGGILLLGAAEHLPAGFDAMFSQRSFGRTIGFQRATPTEPLRAK